MPGLEDDDRLRAVVDTVVDGVILIDSRGVVVTFNPACERLFGFRADEVVGNNVKMLMPPPFREQHDGYIDGYRRTGERKIIGIGREVVGRRKDGSTFPMDLSVGESKKDGISIFVGVIRDLTDRKRAEQAVRELVARLRAVVDTAVDGVILIDSRGAVLMFNPACEGLFGYPAEEVIGENVRMLMPAPFHDEHDAYLDNYRRTGERKIIGIGREVVGRRKDGSVFPMDLSVGEARQDGESIFVGVIHDLTDRKRTEQQLVQAQKMEALGRLTGGIAHDFNNLLTSIMGNLEMLEARVEEGAQREMVQEALEAAQLGSQLTDRLLAFGRRQVLKPSHMDLGKLVLGMRGMLIRTLGETVQVSAAVSGDDLTVITDPGQIENALLNLAINARDAMPQGGRLIVEAAPAEVDADSAAVHADARPGRYVVLSVTDTGAGMAPEVRERAFEPFFTTKQPGSGSGLGLSMVYGLVKQSNGHVQLYSEPGQGTTVRLYLPHVAGPVDQTERRPAADEPRARGETVLVVEDDARVRRVTVHRLTELGYRVVEAGTARAALELLPDLPEGSLLFTDIVMPGGMRGDELAREARRRWPGIRILLTTGYAGPVGAELEDEAAEVLRKPYTRSALARKLRQLLDG